MSTKFLGQVWFLPLNPTPKLILAYLADDAGSNGFCRAFDTKYLAEMANVSPKTILRGLAELEVAGYLRRETHETRQWEIATSPILTIFGKAESPTSDPKPPLPQKSEMPEKAQAEPEVEEVAQVSPFDERLADFCAAWGLTTPSESLINAFKKLETSEGKSDWSESHHNEETGRKWTVNHSMMEAVFPSILHAVTIFQRRAEAGLHVHADSPVDFIERQLWLAPDYQAPLTEPVADPIPIDESAIDAMVMEMNRAGGPNQCHLRTSMIDEDTGKRITETLEVYQGRVLAKYEQFQATSHYFRE